MCDSFDQANANHCWLDRSTEVDMVVISPLFLKTWTTVYATKTAFTLSSLSLLLLHRQICTLPPNVLARLVRLGLQENRVR